MIAQIYEIQTPRDAERCIELGVDHVGTVISSATDWRQPDLLDVMRATAGTRAKNSLLPLFNDLDALCGMLDFYRPHCLHFCESLVCADRSLMDLDRLLDIQANIKERFPDVRIVRSVPIPPVGINGDFPALGIAALFEPVSDFFLTDTWIEQEPVPGYIGITGLTQDWDLASELAARSRIPVILAGGLSPENVFDAVMKVMPAGADSCTRTNAADDSGAPIRFRKDFGKVEKFVREIRKAEALVRKKAAELESALGRLEEELRDRKAALPAHSVRPHQLLKIEELEEEISRAKSELGRLEGPGARCGY